MITETLIKQQFTSFEKIPVTIFNKADDACKSVSNEIAGLIRSKQQQSAHAVLGLATGSTPLKIYQELVRMHKEEGLSFKKRLSFGITSCVVTPTIQFSNQLLEKFRKIYELKAVMPVQMLQTAILPRKLKVA